MLERNVGCDATPPLWVEPQDPSEVISDRTYVMYHGTTSRNAESIQLWGFRPSSGGQLGPGIYLSRDQQKASRYPIGHPKGDKVIIQVLVDVGKVITIRYQNDPVRKTWYHSGYDSAWVPEWPAVRTLEENCVRDPRRIKILQIIRLCELPKLCRSW